MTNLEQLLTIGVVVLLVYSILATISCRGRGNNIEKLMVLMEKGWKVSYSNNYNSSRKDPTDYWYHAPDIGKKFTCHDAYRRQVIMNDMARLKIPEQLTVQEKELKAGAWKDTFEGGDD